MMRKYPLFVATLLLVAIGALPPAAAQSGTAESECLLGTERADRALMTFLTDEAWSAERRITGTRALENPDAVVELEDAHQFETCRRLNRRFSDIISHQVSTDSGESRYKYEVSYYSYDDKYFVVVAFADPGGSTARSSVIVFDRGLHTISSFPMD